MLKSHVSLSVSRAPRYRRLLRFVRFQLLDGLFARFVLSCLPVDDLALILDRINWKLGNYDINLS